LDRGLSTAAAPSAAPPVKPRWLAPAVTAGICLAHLGVAMWLTRVHIADESMLPEGAISLDLVPDGDMFESEAVEPQDEIPPPQEMAAAATVEVPPPAVMDPDALAIPQKREAVKRERDDAPAQEHREAQDRRRIGVAGGRAQTAGLSKAAYAALLAQAVRRHVSGSSSPGAGMASCSFRVSAAGGLSVVSCSGSSAAHQAVLKRAIAATHAPPPPGGSFFASQRILFQ
jgi:protein TonB